MRARSVRKETTPDNALRRCRKFMDATARPRGILDDAHAQVEAYIDEQTQRIRSRGTGTGRGLRIRAAGTLQDKAQMT